MERHQRAMPFNAVQKIQGFCRPFTSALFTVFRTVCICLLVVLAFDKNIAKTSTSAEEILDDVVCGCSASTYTFILDFSLSCPPTNITTGWGVFSVSCLISPFGAPTTKLAPVVLDSVSILELDQLNNVLVEERIDEEFVSGDSFSYSSIINERDDSTSIQNIPKALQLNLSGRNEDGIMLMNVFVITFTNECGAIPVIQAGESAGWVVFSQMSGPIPGFCPTNKPSSLPSDSPSWNPTQEPTPGTSRFPTLFPTLFLTQKPTHNPTSQPTTHLTDEPTRRQSELRTPKPTDNPTSQPTRHGTDEPARQPTEAPTTKTTLQPVKFPTYEPTRRQTETTTHRPTDNPTSQPFNVPIDSPSQHTTNDLTQEPSDKVIPLLTRLPTDEPTLCPSDCIAQKLTSKPTGEPTVQPSEQPAVDPTSQPTKRPTDKTIRPLAPTQGNTIYPFPATRFPIGSPIISSFPTASGHSSMLETMMSMSMSMSMLMSTPTSTFFGMEYSEFFDGESERMNEILND